MKQSRLHEQHLKQGAVLTEVTDWQMPAHYGDPAAEYTAVRSGMGVADLSHRGKIRVGRTVLCTQHCLPLPIPLVIVAILSWEKHRELSGGVPAESGTTEVNFYQRNCKWHFGAMAGREKQKPTSFSDVLVSVPQSRRVVAWARILSGPP